MNERNQDANDSDRYLLFVLGQDLYGTPLMGVREVVEYQKAKPIPHTVRAFLGVINIRGEIIGVIDLRSRFQYAIEENREVAMMVFGTENGTLAAVADRMEGVVKIPKEAIDPTPRVESRLPPSFLLGIGRCRDRLVTLIDLPQILEREEIGSLGGGQGLRSAG